MDKLKKQSSTSSASETILRDLLETSHNTDARNRLLSFQNSITIPPTIPPDINQEISDLENLIKKLQVEITEMTEMANKPLKEYVPPEAEESSSDENTTLSPIANQNVAAFPVSNQGGFINNPETNVLSVRRAFKLLWKDSNSATTSDPPPDAKPNKTEKDNDIIKTKIKISNKELGRKLENCENVNNLKDYLISRNSQSIVKVLDCDGHSLKEDIPKPVEHDVTKPEEKKPQGAMRFGLLMHIFGDRQKKEPKPSNQETISNKDIKIDEKSAKKEEEKKKAAPEKTSIQSAPKPKETKSKVTIISPNKSATKTVEPIPNEIEVVNKPIIGEEHTKSAEPDQPITNNDETKKCDRLPDIIETPPQPDKAKSKSALTIELKKSQSLKKVSRHDHHDKLPNTAFDNDVKVDKSKDRINKSVTKVNEGNQDQSETKSGVGQRLSIINIYLDNSAGSKEQKDSDASIQNTTSETQVDENLLMIKKPVKSINKIPPKVSNDKHRNKSVTIVTTEQLESQNKKVDEKSIGVTNTKSDIGPCKTKSNAKVQASGILKTHKSDVLPANVPSLKTIGTTVDEVIKISESIKSKLTENKVPIKVDRAESGILQVNLTAKKPKSQMYIKPTSIESMNVPEDDFQSQQQIESVMISDDSKDEVSGSYVSNSSIKDTSMQTDPEIYYVEDVSVRDQTTSSNAFVIGETESVTENLHNASDQDNDYYTDEYESIGDDGESYTEDSATERDIVIQRTDITATNGDNFSDVFEDSQDFFRDAATDAITKQSKKTNK